MEREAFRQRMQQYKQARENNPQLKYWDWKKYADGGTIDEDPPQNTSERPITNFDPKGDPYNPTYGYNPGAGYVSNSDPLGSLYVEGALLNPVFKLAGNAVSNVARGLTKYSSKYVPEVRRTVPKDMRSIEAAYLQFTTPGQYTKWYNKIPLLGTYPIVNKQFQNYEENKDKAREQR